MGFTLRSLFSRFFNRKQVVVHVLVSGVPAIIDPRNISDKSWAKRVSAHVFVGHDTLSVSTAKVGESIIFRNTVDGPYFSMTEQEFESTAYLFLMMKGYSLKSPFPLRQSDSH